MKKVFRLLFHTSAVLVAAKFTCSKRFFFFFLLFFNFISKKGVKEAVCQEIQPLPLLLSLL